MAEKENEMSEEDKKGVRDFLKKMAEDMAASPIKMGRDIKYPINVKEVKVFFHRRKDDIFAKTGEWVSIRPVAEKYEQKTYLGIFLGSIPVECNVAFHEEDEALLIQGNNNPAIFVPELKKVIYGYESWWGVIDSPDKLREITDESIQDQWYVKALKEIDEKLAKKKEEEGTDGQG